MLAALLIALGLGSMDTCAGDHCVSLIQLRKGIDDDTEGDEMLGGEEDDALTELGSVRRIVSEESDEEADEESAEDEVEDESEDEDEDEYEEIEGEEDDDESGELPSGESLGLSLLELRDPPEKVVRQDPQPPKKPPRKHVDEDGDPDDEEED